MATAQTLRLCHLYPKEMNTYADSGNISVLRHRLEWRGLELEVNELGLGEELTPEFAKEVDMFYFGGGQDLAQTQIAGDFLDTKSSALKEALLGDKTPNAVGLFICGGYQLAGQRYTIHDDLHKGAGIFGAVTTQTFSSRLVGDIAISCEIENQQLEIIGYENHAGRTYIIEKNAMEKTEDQVSASDPLGRVIYGNGNNKDDDTEGAINARSIGTYIHGPLLPKNPVLSDLLISWALEHHYGEVFELAPLDDSFAELARSYFL